MGESEDSWGPAPLDSVTELGRRTGGRSDVKTRKETGREKIKRREEREKGKSRRRDSVESGRVPPDHRRLREPQRFLDGTHSPTVSGDEVV